MTQSTPRVARFAAKRSAAGERRTHVSVKAAVSRAGWLLERSRLRLGVTASWIAFWSALLGAFAAMWGVGIETIRLMGELPRGLAQGSPFQETFIKISRIRPGRPVWPGLRSFCGASVVRWQPM